MYIYLVQEPFDLTIIFFIEYKYLFTVNIVKKKYD